MPRLLFVTGRLAAKALEKTLKGMKREFNYEIAVLPAKVGSLMTTPFIARHLEDDGFDQIIIPGLCKGNLRLIQDKLNIPTVRGPKDLRDLPIYFGGGATRRRYGRPRLKILAEIVDAPYLTPEEILERADYYRRNGADIIDLGCTTDREFTNVGKVVSLLKEKGFSVSIDSFNKEEILEADAAGVDYLLSINSSNLEIAPKLHCKVVVISDFGAGLESLERNVRAVEELGLQYIIDPVLDPLNFGFVDSLQRFYQARKRYPGAEILMGIGNLSELTDADSSGINALLLGIATELRINYILTTEVAPWCRGAVRETDIARRLMEYAHRHKILPKNVEDRLITAKDPRVKYYTEEQLREMQKLVTDRNFRIFADDKYIYVFNSQSFVKDTNIERIFAKLGVEEASHAFYLGQELTKAQLAVTLGKNYIQDSELRWGYLNQLSKVRK